MRGNRAPASPAVERPTGTERGVGISYAWARRMFAQGIHAAVCASLAIKLTTTTTLKYHYFCCRCCCCCFLLFFVLFYLLSFRSHSRSNQVLQMLFSKRWPFGIVEPDFLWARSHWGLKNSIAPCGLRGCKNRPAPFPDWMSYKATKPGLVSVLYLSMRIVLYCTVLLFIRAPFYVSLVFVAVFCLLVVHHHHHSGFLVRLLQPRP